jgi:hypothetical protein
MLKRDWRKYLVDYMQGASRSSDALMTTALIEIKKDVAKEILEHITKTVENTTDEDERKLMSGFVERFQWLAIKNVKESNKALWKFW